MLIEINYLWREPMDYFFINMILTSSSVILALIGFYFVVRIWIKWKNTDMDILKARVFLNKKFLEKNGRYVFLSGASLAAHQFMGFLIQLNFITGDLISTLSEILNFMSLVFLLILAYEWLVLISAKKNLFY
ncbi:MAG: hypothetical protein O8C64_09875 [Candidatus Methanoperedens sp.]|nr:hypothetical protein [Candidatus Methanoperedens sp.]MCZ7403412.1 hypothetical protein [Candidatus Methanoperedens sp.]